MPGVWRDEDSSAFPSCGRPRTQKPAVPLADHIGSRAHPGEHIGAGAQITVVPTLFAQGRVMLAGRSVAFVAGALPGDQLADGGTGA